MVLPKNIVTDNSIALGTSATQILSYNPRRAFLFFQNVSAVYVGISIDTTEPTVDGNGLGGLGTIVLAPGSGLVFDTNTPHAPDNGFKGIASSGSGNNLTILEG